MSDISAVSTDETEKSQTEEGDNEEPRKSDQVLDEKTKAAAEPDEDWERELLAELNEFELVNGVKNDKTDEQWEAEIQELLKSDLP
ncbi:unnamed protein product [Nippostrongylus brasiliensis]|uniref:DSS1/SEM1 family-domain-containing protein n=1 Tax=Nippostrongylus brasiliensis TaxID=27835 RepID=A0A0N4XNT6_NIPBR|nr:unnamed protein product [Nippostrongylus brasiliensis]